MATAPPHADETLTQDIDRELSSAGRKISYEEFFEWAPDSRIAEWVDGEIIMPSPPRFGHQDISDFLAATLRIYTQVFDLGQVISAPFQVKPGVDFPGREPDILFVAAPHELEQDTPRLERAPDVVIEIVSPETAETDREDKYREYAAAGVPEYWLVNGLTYRAELYWLNAAGGYELVFSGSTGVLRSEVIEGFALEVSWLWQVPRPRPEVAVLEMVGARYWREVLMAAAKVLPADEFVLALPDALATLPPDILAQVLPDVLSGLPADILAQALPGVLSALPPDIPAQALPSVLTALPSDVLVDTLAALGKSLPPSERAKLRDALS